MPKKIYNVAIIGCGRMGWMFNEDKLANQPVSHMAAYKLNNNTKVVAICDIDPKRLAGMAQKYGISKTYTDYKKMLKQERLDIVSVCVPTPFHAQVTMDAAQSGVKAIFCEKPIATSIKETQKMISVCRKRQVKLAINYSRRWGLSYRELKKMLNLNRIGKIDLITAFSPVGLSNAGTHLFDILRYLFGDVQSVAGVILPDCSSDPGGRGILRFKNGLTAMIDCSFRDYLLFEIHILGAKGLIKVGGHVVGDKIELYMNQQGKNEGGIKELRKVDFSSSRASETPIVAAVNNLVNALKSNERILCTGEDGQASLEIALAFHESSKKSGKVIQLPLSRSKSRLIPRQTSFTKDGLLK